MNQDDLKDMILRIEYFYSQEPNKISKERAILNNFMGQKKAE
jgi:hypothetical protein